MKKERKELDRILRLELLVVALTVNFATFVDNYMGETEVPLKDFLNGLRKDVAMAKQIMKELE